MWWYAELFGRRCEGFRIFIGMLLTYAVYVFRAKRTRKGFLLLLLLPAAAVRRMGRRRRMQSRKEGATLIDPGFFRLQEIFLWYTPIMTNLATCSCLLHSSILPFIPHYKIPDILS